MRRISPAFFAVLALCACPSPTEPDAGPPDAGVAPACDSPDDCKTNGYGGVCRQLACAKNVPCTDDFECGLGEACVDHQCAFIGCAGDTDCPTGLCRPGTFSCAECKDDGDCPFNRPLCQASTQKCVQCSDDTQCGVPGPPHCEALSGDCVHCLNDDHCPQGLTCSGGACRGAASGEACPTGTSCDEGLTCVLLNTTGGQQQVCLPSCNLYAPTCPVGEACFALKGANSPYYIFDMGGLLGVCFSAPQNARNYRDTCALDQNEISNCQPFLACVPDSAQSSSCRTYCDPGANNSCPAPEQCHHFVGDFDNREYGLCYADNGYGDRCTTDVGCRTGLSCQPFDDPSDYDELTPHCKFNVGTQPGLAPCAPRADGGTANALCKSGACRSDVPTTTAPFFCFASCATDSDCTIMGRTGTCDGTYEFLGPSTRNCRRQTTETGCDNEGCFWDSLARICDYIPASEKGCRPGCVSNSTCDEYAVDGGLMCRARLLLGAASSGLKLNCGRPTAGGQRAGAPCVSGFQCASGFCALDDARGTRRPGYCLEACQSAGDCAAPDAGDATGTLDCLNTTFGGYIGADGLRNTPDDVLSVKKVCTGAACVKDEDCSGDGGVRCVPDVSPLDAGALVLRCRPSLFGALPDAGPLYEAAGPCTRDTDCVSGVCGTLIDTSRACLQACDAAGASPCPSGLTCRAGAYKLTATTGTLVSLDGCAP